MVGSGPSTRSRSATRPDTARTFETRADDASARLAVTPYRPGAKPSKVKAPSSPVVALSSAVGLATTTVAPLARAPVTSRTRPLMPTDGVGEGSGSSEKGCRVRSSALPNVTLVYPSAR